ncbi:MAG: DUF1013 domain-containing protein [Holosporaceae bacterium]|nr:DUF1013 domain-containing protein [Holosporaceae bacterium]
MATLIMPQGTAIWLIENTALTFEQIANFCGLHPLEVQALADEQVSAGMIGIDPVNLGQLTREEIERCSRDPSAKLHMAIQKRIVTSSKSKKKYTPLLKRQERPNAIAWLIKFFPELSDSSICSLVSTTKATVQSMRNKTHARMNEVRPKDPVLLGFCTQVELDTAVSGIKHSGNVENNK